MALSFYPDILIELLLLVFLAKGLFVNSPVSRFVLTLEIKECYKFSQILTLGALIIFFL